MSLSFFTNHGLHSILFTLFPILQILLTIQDLSPVYRVCISVKQISVVTPAWSPTVYHSINVRSIFSGIWGYQYVRLILYEMINNQWSHKNELNSSSMVNSHGHASPHTLIFLIQSRHTQKCSIRFTNIRNC